MSVRVSEAIVRVGQEHAFLERLRELVADFPLHNTGLVEHEILLDISNPHIVQYISRWRDEASLINYAGQSWRTEPVTFPDESTFITQPLALRHFTSEKISPSTWINLRRNSPTHRLSRRNARDIPESAIVYPDGMPERIAPSTSSRVTDVLTK